MANFEISILSNDFSFPSKFHGNVENVIDSYILEIFRAFWCQT